MIRGSTAKPFRNFCCGFSWAACWAFLPGLPVELPVTFIWQIPVEAWLTGVLQAAAPWGIPVTSGVLLAICLGFYLSAKRLYMAWDGEDEIASRSSGRKLNYTLLCSSLAPFWTSSLSRSASSTRTAGGWLC